MPSDLERAVGIDILDADAPDCHPIEEARRSVHTIGRALFASLEEPMAKLIDAMNQLVADAE